MKVLLLGAGRGEATCGILYLASYLRRHGVEAFVRLWDDDEDAPAMTRSLSGLLEHVQPGLVGISLKWFNHLSRGLELARAVKALDPGIRVVTGGNSASYYWRELSATGAFDDLVLGDGEVPLLGLARGDRDVPNVVRGNSAPPLTYVQSADSTDVYYSNFDELFLSGLDASSFSGWVQPGKGCSENCVYCGGTRGMEQASFGRPTSFLRAPESVALDHEEIAKRTWQLRYDFAGGSAGFLGRTWAGFDLKGHSATYFLWGVPPRSLIDALASTFGRVYLVLDVGCFSQTQRQELMQRGLLKPCPTDAELLEAVAACRAHPNLTLEVCGIAGLPHTSKAALAEELPLVDQLLELGCDVGCQRLECQPGALVTRHPDRFGMIADASTFDGFVSWFAGRGHDSAGEFPMIRFEAAGLERAVQRSFEKLYERIQKQPEPLTPKTLLVSRVVSKQTPTLAEWLGAWRAPAKHAAQRLTVLRNEDGGGLACAPALVGFDDPLVESGPMATGLLAALDTFAKPARADSSPRELVEGLLAGGFLKKVEGVRRCLLLALAGCAPGFLPGTADVRLRELVDARSTKPSDFAFVLSEAAEVHRDGHTVRGQAAGAEALASLVIEPGAQTELYRHHHFSWVGLGDGRGLLVERSEADRITRVVELPMPTTNDPIPWQAVYYSRAWNEDDDATRVQQLKPMWHAQGRYLDATNDHTGVEGVSFMIGRFRKLAQGTHVKATTGLADAGEGWATWDWVITSKPGGERVLFFGFDIFHLDAEGKVDLLVGFVNGERRVTGQHRNGIR